MKHRNKHLEKNITDEHVLKELENKFGFIPNLYKKLSESKIALHNFTGLYHSKSSLTTIEKNVIRLVVSEVNNCHYSLSLYTELCKRKGMDEMEIIEFRSALSSIDNKLDSLVKLAYEMPKYYGNVTSERLKDFFKKGYSKGALIDVAIVVGETIKMNYLAATLKLAIDFPWAPKMKFRELP